MRILYAISILVLLQGCIGYKWEIRMTEAIERERENWETVKKDRLAKYNTVKKEKLAKYNAELANYNTELAKIVGIEVPNYLKITPIRHKNHFNILNSGTTPVFINFNRSILVMGGKSLRVTSGEASKMISKVVQPDQPIGPGTIAEVSFYTNDDLRNEVIKKHGGFHLTVAVENEGITNYVKFRVRLGQPPEKPSLKLQLRMKKEMEEWEEGVEEWREEWNKNFVYTGFPRHHSFLCLLTLRFYGGWCWYTVFRDPTSEEKLEALKLARIKFGKKVQNVSLIGRG